MTPLHLCYGCDGPIFGHNWHDNGEHQFHGECCPEPGCQLPKRVELPKLAQEVKGRTEFTALFLAAAFFGALILPTIIRVYS